MLRNSYLYGNISNYIDVAFKKNQNQNIFNEYNVRKKHF
jgi:hypothetical protein